MLYLKLNAMRLDPLGEDPSTPEQRRASLQVLNNWSDDRLLNCRLEVSPRLDKISRHYTRLRWHEVIQACLGGEKEFTISEEELQIFKKTGRGHTVKEVMGDMGVPSTDRGRVLAMFKRLGRLGGIDFLG